MPCARSSAEHQAAAAARAAREPVCCAILTVSDTRTPANDEGGALLARLATEAGHVVVDRSIVRDEPTAIRERLEHWIAQPGIHAILCTGGTGIARRDTTIDVVRRLICIELEGFGELFRMLSYEQVGGAAMLSRAVAGLVVRQPGTAAPTGAEMLIFAMPGSMNAIETAMTRLIGPQLAHLVWERRR
jgi:molybdenum cofactor biosynthesis protein B